MCKLFSYFLLLINLPYNSYAVGYVQKESVELISFIC